MITRVEVAKAVDKQLDRAPQHIAAKFLAWAEDVETPRLEVVRKVPGYNDHPLKGELAGERAIRLSRQWRAVYEVRSTKAEEQIVEFVFVEEVHPHDY